VTFVSLVQFTVDITFFPQENRCWF